MKNTSHIIGIPVSSAAYEAEESMGIPATAASSPEAARAYIQSKSYGSSQSKKNKVTAVINWMNKFSKKAENYTQGIREHVRLGPKISETFKGKLSLGARILQAGGVERVFRQIFSVGEGERLLKASQCYLSTTAGPIAGLLFISNEKIAFHSERSLRFTSPKGDVTRIPYKVLIPLGKIKRANTSENADKPTQKYIQIITMDDFEFWFMGFVSYQRSFNSVQEAVFQSTMNCPRRADKLLLQ